MSVTVEFYGIPRERVGMAETAVSAGSLGHVLAELARRFPRFADDCLQPSGGRPEAARLKPLFVASLGGEHFLHDPGTPLADGDCLLILSADAGG